MAYHRCVDIGKKNMEALLSYVQHSLHLILKYSFVTIEIYTYSLSRFIY